MSRIVRTVRGDVEPSELGPCDAHEHLFLVSPLQPGDELDDVGKAIEETRSLAAAGAAALVEWTPLELGRKPRRSRRRLRGDGRARRRRQRHAPRGALQRPQPAARARPRCARGPVRRRPRPLRRRQGRCELPPPDAVRGGRVRGRPDRAGAHRWPVCVHTELGTMGLWIVERLGHLGVHPHAVVLAHLDPNPDAGEHAETAAAGAWLQLDGPGRTKYWPDSTILRLIADLAEAGHGGRILLAGDTGRRSIMRAYGGGPGLDYLFARFKPRLERELGAELVHRIFVDNPAEAFAFEPRGGSRG